MLKYILMGMHFTQMAFGSLDPAVVELIRTERLMRLRDEEAKARTDAAANDTNHDDAEDIREAA